MELKVQAILPNTAPPPPPQFCSCLLVVQLRGCVKPSRRQADPVKVGLLDPAFPLAVWVLLLVGLQPLVDLEASVVHGHPVQVGRDASCRWRRVWNLADPKTD